MKITKKIIYFLSGKDRKKGLLLLIMLMMMTIFDVIGVASILPFMGVLTKPEIVETNQVLNYIYKFSGSLGVDTINQFLFLLGIIAFFLLIFSLFFKGLTKYFEAHYIQICQFNVSKRIVGHYLHQPYSWFLNRNSSEIGKTVLSEVSMVISRGLSSIMNLISQSISIIMMLSLLIYVNPKLSITMGSIISLLYLIIYKINQSFLNRIGKERLESNRLRFKSISEAFNASKAVKVGGLEEYFIKSFSKPSKRFALNNATLSAITLLPRFFLEAIAFGGTIVLILYLIKTSETYLQILPTIALYILVGYRLLPAVQNIYSCISKLKYVEPTIKKLHEDVTSLKKINQNYFEKKCSFTNNIELNNISFSYPNSDTLILKDISLIIPYQSIIGIVGSTGSGKTTLIDIILGLLKPNHGELKIDGKAIDEDNVKDWQNSIGYVPQNIFLADDTVTANIAFGIKDENIDMKRIYESAKTANIHDFIINDLPLKYSTVIGERGSRLSGGQCQRIGFARALYHNPKLLILDEATSSLDNLTEHKIIEALHNMSKKITIIIVAHRLSTVKRSDNIFLLNKGKLMNKGTFDELIKDSKHFLNMYKIPTD